MGAREAVTWTYLHAMGDAAADLRPGRENRLVNSLAPSEHPDRAEIERIALEANSALSA
jgi:putative ATP-dependent endonuclease of the OLD family